MGNGGITLELELVSNATYCIIAPNADAAFTNLATSSNWGISNCQIKADVVQIDNSLDNEYATMLLEGKKYLYHLQLTLHLTKL